jgi:hypothetical protein
MQPQPPLLVIVVLAVLPKGGVIALNIGNSVKVRAKVDGEKTKALPHLLTQRCCGGPVPPRQNQLPKNRSLRKWLRKLMRLLRKPQKKLQRQWQTLRQRQNLQHRQRNRPLRAKFIAPWG